MFIRKLLYIIQLESLNEMLITETNLKIVDIRTSMKRDTSFCSVNLLKRNDILYIIILFLRNNKFERGYCPHKTY